jgi:hypothetical protein
MGHRFNCKRRRNRWAVILCDDKPLLSSFSVHLKKSEVALPYEAQKEGISILYGLLELHEKCFDTSSKAGLDPV